MPYYGYSLSYLGRASGGSSSYSVPCSIFLNNSNTEYIDLGTNLNTILNSASTPFALSLFLNRNTTSSVDTFLGNWTDQLLFRFDLSGTISLLFNTTGAGGTDSFTTTDTFLSTSLWYHIVVVYDPSATTNADTCKLWVNGVQRSGTYTNTLDRIASSVNPLRIGVGNSTPFDGYINQFTCIQRASAVSGTEIGTWYNAGSPLDPIEVFGSSCKMHITGSDATWNGSNFDFTDRTGNYTGIVSSGLTSGDKVCS